MARRGALRYPRRSKLSRAAFLDGCAVNSERQAMLFYYFLIVVSPFVRHPLWAGHLAGNITFVKALGLLCCAYAVFYIVVRQRTPGLLSVPQTWMFAALALITVISYAVVGTADNLALSPIALYASQGANLFVTASVVDSGARLRNTLLVAIGALDYGSLHVLREWQHAGFAVGYRPGYVLGDPNVFALSVLVFFPAVLYLLNERPLCLWQRIFCLGSLPLILAAFVLCASRGAFLGLALALMLMVFRSRHRLFYLLLALMGIAMMAALPTSPIRRLLEPSHSDQRSTNLRVTVWRAGLRMIQEHPLTGIGSGQFKKRVVGYEDRGEQAQLIAHNTYVELAAELGIPALLLFLGILGFSLYQLQRNYRKLRGGGDELLLRATMAVEAGLLGSTITIMTLTATSHKFLWLAIFLGITINRLAKEKNIPAPKGQPIYAGAQPRFSLQRY